MDKNTYLRLLEQDGTSLIEAALKDLHAHVPSCPEWDVAQLVGHTGRVHRHKCAIVKAGSTQYPEDLDAETPPDQDDSLIDWYRAGLDDLLATLASKDPEMPVWSWSGDNRVAFWNRRMAQETAVHRWDAENAVGEAGPIDAELASDGIDEMLGAFIPGEDLPYHGREGSIGLRCRDVDGEWVVELRSERAPTYEPGSKETDALLEGPADDLLLLLWRRIEPIRVQVSGDEMLVADLWRYLEGPGQ